LLSDRTGVKRFSDLLAPSQAGVAVRTETGCNQAFRLYAYDLRRVTMGNGP